MKSFTRARLMTSTLLLGGAVFIAPAHAQDSAGAEEAQTVVVTGSRIPRPDLETAAPIATVGAEDIGLKAGSSNIENVLNDMPQFTPSTTSASNNPGGGVATANMRSLGASRNLVLVDGRRYVAYDVNQIVDLNTIPSALVERVEVVTGGRSAVYGSDAISGVINFVTKKDFSGVEVNSQYNVTGKGDGQMWDINATIGANLDDGRGNVVAHVGYLKRQGTYAAARHFSRDAISDGIINGVRQLYKAGSASAPQTRMTLSAAQQAAAGSYFGTGSVTNLDFNPDGSLGAYVDSTDSYNHAPVNYLQVPQERWLVSTAAHYEISPAVVPYIEAQFINNRVSTELAATPIGNSTPYGDGSVGALNLHVHSTFLAPNVRAGLAAIDASEATANGHVQGDGYVRVASWGSRTTGLGPRQNNDDRNAFRVIGGVRGDIGGGWNYDGYYMYARTKNAQRQNGNVAISNFIAATTTAFEDPTTKAISVTPWAGVPGGGTLVCADATARAAGCVPANIFGLNNLTPDQAAYLGIGATNLQEYTTEVASLVFTNGEIFNLGGGGAGLAAGVEWRREAGSVMPDQYLASGNVAGFNPGRPTAGSYEVKEAFAEVNIPILRDQGIHLLEVNGAGRITDYSNAPGTVYTYAGGVTFAPIEDFSLRGQYSVAIRGPSVNEMYLGNTVSFAGNIDRCNTADAAPGGSLHALCLANGVPAAVLGNAVDRAALVGTSVNPPTFLGGNAGLKEETATTWTVGAVFKPSFFRGFSATVDYWNIEIENYISTVGTSNIGTACFTHQVTAICDQISRNALGQVERIDDRNANSGGLRTSGIDVGVAYNHRFDSLFGAEGGFLNLAFNGTWLEKYDLTPIVGVPLINECKGKFGRTCGAPVAEWKHSARLSLGTDTLSGSLQWRHFSTTQDDNPTVSYAVEELKGKNYFDFTIKASPTDNFDLSVGVSNLFDTDPEILASSQSGGNGQQSNTYPTVYDVMGRSFFVSARLRY